VDRRLAALLKHAHLRLAAMTDEALAPLGIVGRDWLVGPARGTDQRRPEGPGKSVAPAG
jgi:hypothetical protein